MTTHEVFDDIRVRNIILAFNEEGRESCAIRYRKHFSLIFFSFFFHLAITS